MSPPKQLFDLPLDLPSLAKRNTQFRLTNGEFAFGDLSQYKACRNAIALLLTLVLTSRRSKIGIRIRQPQ